MTANDTTASCPARWDPSRMSNRVFEMEVLAGEASLETEVMQHGARFRLDYSKV